MNIYLFTYLHLSFSLYSRSFSLSSPHSVCSIITLYLDVFVPLCLYLSDTRFGPLLYRQKKTKLYSYKPFPKRKTYSFTLDVQFVFLLLVVSMLFLFPKYIYLYVCVCVSIFAFEKREIKGLYHFDRSK